MVITFRQDRGYLSSRRGSPPLAGTELPVNYGHTLVVTFRRSVHDSGNLEVGTGRGVGDKCDAISRILSTRCAVKQPRVNVDASKTLCICIISIV